MALHVEGEGLLFYSTTILPFVDHFPKDTELYRVMSTKPQEATKADKAQAKIPKKPVVKKEHGFDPATDKVKTYLRFEEVDKTPPPS